MRFIGAGTERISRVRETTLSGIIGPAEEMKKGVLAVTPFRQGSNTKSPGGSRTSVLDQLTSSSFGRESITTSLLPPTPTAFRNRQLRDSGSNKMIIPLNPALHEDDDYYLS